MAGAAVTWFFTTGLSNQMVTAEKRFIGHLEDAQNEMLAELRRELKVAEAGMGPAIAEHMSSAAKSKFQEIRDSFLPFMSDLIQRWRGEQYGEGPAQYGEGPLTFDVRSILASFPGVLEAVSMYYAMIDPETTWRARLEIAAGLAYIIAPNDWLPDSEIDDMAVVLYVWNKVQEQVTPRHIEQAKAWLRREAGPQMEFEFTDTHTIPEQLEPLVAYGKFSEADSPEDDFYYGTSHFEQGWDPDVFGDAIEDWDDELVA